MAPKRLPKHPSNSFYPSVMISRTYAVHTLYVLYMATVYF